MSTTGSADTARNMVETPYSRTLTTALHGHSSLICLPVPSVVEPSCLLQALCPIPVPHSPYSSLVPVSPLSGVSRHSSRQ